MRTLPLCRGSLRCRRQLALAGISLVAMLASSAQAQIRIALLGPMTGSMTQVGDMMREGVETAIELANAAGGVAGQRIELVLVDDACEPKQGPIAANRVANDGIRYVVGPSCSGTAVAAAPIFDNESIVAITPSATSPALTDGKQYEFIFRSIGRDDQQGPVAARFILEHVKPSAIAVLHDKQTYGHGVAASARDALQQGGGNVVLFEGINAGDTDYSAVVSKLKGLGVDFVYYGGYHPELGLLLRQSAEQAFRPRMMGTEGVGHPDLTAIAGAAVEGLFLTLPADFSANPANAALVKAFVEKNRNPAGAYQLSAFAAVQVILASIGTVGDNPTKVAEYLRQNRFDTVIGQISWNHQGDLNDFEFHVFEWHQDGSRTRVMY